MAYVRASTDNPLGWKPWQTRLSGLGRPARVGYYVANTFPLPTTGRGPFLLQPGVAAQPSFAGGMGRLGQEETNIWPWLIGAALAVGFLGGFIGRPKITRARVGRKRARIARLQEQVRALEA